MKKLGWILSLMLVASAGPAFGQSACPSNPNDCPTDVGACLAESCPCDGGQAWKNHGQYVKCVVHLRNDLRKAGCLDSDARRTIARCAAKSTCGKEDAVLCCAYDTSATCDDLLPGNGVAEGFCSDDATKACDTAIDCVTVVSGPKVSRHPENCTDRGRTVVGTGSVCAGCPLPTPVPTP